MLVSKGSSGSAVIDGKIYIVGGWNDINSMGIASTEIYDPETDSRSSRANMRFQRGGLTVESVNNKLYAIGGAINWTTNDVCNIVEEYDLGKNSWSIKNEMPGKRGWHSSCVLNDKIYIIGGLDINTFVTSNLVYDPKTDIWDSIAPLNHQRQQASCCVHDNKIYVFGGFNGNLSWEARTEVYDPSADTWSVTSLIPGAFSSHHAFMYGNKIYIIGGGGITDDIYSEPVWMFDPVYNIWQEMEDMPADFMGSTQQIIDDNVYIFGGYTHSQGVQDFSSKNDVYRLNLSLIRPKSEITGMIDLYSSNNDLTIRIYPNPCDDVITIDIENNSTGNRGLKIEFLTIAGQVIYQKEFKTRNAHFAEQIDLSGYSKGIYLVKVRQAHTVYTGKVVVK